MDPFKKKAPCGKIYHSHFSITFHEKQIHKLYGGHICYKIKDNALILTITSKKDKDNIAYHINYKFFIIFIQ